MLPYLTFSFFGFFLVFALAELLFEHRPRTKEFGNKRIIVNFALHGTTALVFTAIPVSLISVSLITQENNWGLFSSHLSNANFMALFLIGMATLLGRTFVAYWAHRLFHEVPLLWRIHKVHHNDPVMDISVALRRHPIEAVVGSVLFIPVVMAVGIPPTVILIVEVFIVFGLFFEHADIILPKRASAFLSRYFSTPQIHEIHHAADHKLTDSNYSPVLMIWDHVFGTYTPPLDEQPRIGLGDKEDKRADNFVAQLSSPFRK